MDIIIPKKKPMPKFIKYFFFPIICKLICGQKYKNYDSVYHLFVVFLSSLYKKQIPDIHEKHFAIMDIRYQRILYYLFHAIIKRFRFCCRECTVIHQIIIYITIHKVFIRTRTFCSSIHRTYKIRITVDRF